MTDSQSGSCFNPEAVEGQFYARKLQGALRTLCRTHQQTTLHPPNNHVFVCAVCCVLLCVRCVCVCALCVCVDAPSLLRLASRMPLLCHVVCVCVCAMCCSVCVCVSVSVSVCVCVVCVYAPSVLRLASRMPLPPSGAANRPGLATTPRRRLRGWFEQRHRLRHRLAALSTRSCLVEQTICSVKLFCRTK